MVTTSNPPGTGVSTYQEGVGYPFMEPVRMVPTGDDILSPYYVKPFKVDINGNPIAPPSQNGAGGFTLPQQYQKKSVRRVDIDLSNIFDAMFISEPGTVIFFAGQAGGTAAPIEVRPDTIENDFIPLTFNNGISGIPFKQFWVRNNTAQAGVTAQLVVISDTPFDRIGLSG